MTRRNLRKWAEAKQRRLEQPAAGLDGARPLLAWLDEALLFGTAVAPTVWLPMEPALTDKPLFPNDAGDLLHALLNPEPQPGPPYTHTIRNAPTEYDHNGYPLPPPFQPSMTITQLPSDSEDHDPAAAFSCALETLRTLYSLTPMEVTQAQWAFSQLVAEYGAQTPGVEHVRHGHPGDWFRSIRWSASAWQALHGAAGPRKGWER